MSSRHPGPLGIALDTRFPRGRAYPLDAIRLTETTFDVDALRPYVIGHATLVLLGDVEAIRALSRHAERAVTHGETFADFLEGLGGELAPFERNLVTAASELMTRANVAELIELRKRVEAELVRRDAANEGEEP